MNYERLKTFIAVVENKSFSEVAKIRFISQPTVTMQIKALETELNTKLFERTTNRIQLTHSAKILIKYAKEIIRLTNVAQKEILQTSGEIHGTIKMSCSLTVGEHVLPLYLKKFQQAYPMIQLEVAIANSKQIVTQIRNHQLDLGLIETPTEDANIKSEPFLQDELFVVAPPGYFGDGVEEITLDQLRASPIIFREKGSGTRKVAEKELEKVGLLRDDLNVMMELGSTETVKSTIQAGVGISILSKYSIFKEEQLQLLQSYRIKDVSIKRSFYMIHHEEQILKTTAEVLMKSIRSGVSPVEEHLLHII